MDEHMNTAILGNYANNCENMEVRKASAQGVLKGVESGSMQFMTREQEYIDHTLLGPEYMSNTMSNSFIIDLMEQHDSTGQASSDCGMSSLGASEAFPSEAQLHTIFQLVNRQENIRSQQHESSTEHLIHHTDKEILESELLNMHGNLLNDPKFQLFYKQQNITAQETLNQDFNVPQLQSLPDTARPLTPIRWPKKERYGEPLEQIPDIVAPLGTTAKKILPHKKRISKKLKILDRPEDLYHLDEESPSRIERLVISNGAQFECEICGSISESQVQFFSHLKGHYEPSAVDAVKSMEASSIIAADDTSTIEKSSEPHLAGTGDRVFNEVELNFESFSEVVGLTTQQQLISDNDHERDPSDMKILDSTTIAKCMGFVVETTETNQACNVHEEVEFSDTEDMLEGIRGVVDKVSVDDTSDDLDMPITSVSKESWFANSAFSELHYKEEERVENESFPRANLVPIPIEQLQNHPTERSQTPIADMSSIKMDDDEFNINDHDNDVDSSDDQNDSLNADFGKKRKRGRPRGSTKKRTNGVDVKMEDDSSNEIGDNNKRRYICHKCSREFNSCNALKYHDLSHTGHRPHQCDVCGKSFFAQSALKSHLRVHTGDKPYECEKCQRKFRQWSDLKYHNVSIHSDEKNYQCEFCGKSFSRKYSLVIHRRIHTSERNYKCEFCPKTFRASSYLQNHRKIHTGEKPYECGTCGKKFRVSGDLRRHSRTHERVRKSSSGPRTSNENSTNQSKPCQSEVLLKMDCQRETKEDLIFLDKMASKMDHLFKTEAANVNSSIENMNLSFVT